MGFRLVPIGEFDSAGTRKIVLGGEALAWGPTLSPPLPHPFLPPFPSHPLFSPLPTLRSPPLPSPLVPSPS